MGILSTVLRIFIFWEIYRALYGGKTEVDGITLTMVTTSFILSLGLESVFFVNDYYLPDRIQNGSIATELLLPVNIHGRMLADNLGHTLFQLLFHFVPALAVSMLFHKIAAPAEFPMLLLFIGSALLGYGVLWTISFAMQMLSFLADQYMECDDDQKCICQCAVRVNDTALVYAGLDAGSNPLYAFFFHLFYAGTDLSGTVIASGNPAGVWGAVVLDCRAVFDRDTALEKGAEKACCAGRMTDDEKRYILSCGSLHQNRYEVLVPVQGQCSSPLAGCFSQRDHRDHCHLFHLAEI